MLLIDDVHATGWRSCLRLTYIAFQFLLVVVRDFWKPDPIRAASQSDQRS